MFCNCLFQTNWQKQKEVALPLLVNSAVRFFIEGTSVLSGNESEIQWPQSWLPSTVHPSLTSLESGLTKGTFHCYWVILPQVTVENISATCQHLTTQNSLWELWKLVSCCSFPIRGWGQMRGIQGQSQPEICEIMKTLRHISLKTSFFLQSTEGCAAESTKKLMDSYPKCCVGSKYSL